MISPFYDSMIAKLIVHAPTRAQALARLDSALAKTRIVGLPNNVAFLRDIINTDSFSGANLDTALIERESGVLFNQHPFSLSTLVVTAIVQQLASESAAEHLNADPFGKATGFRAYSDYTRSFSLVYDERSYRARISNWHNASGNNASGNNDKKGSDNISKFELVIEQEIINTNSQDNVNVAAQTETVYEGQVSYDSGDAHNHTLWLDGARISAQSWVHNETVYVFTDSGRDEITLIDIMAHVGEDTAAVGSLKSPMPGQVVAFKVAVGDSVKKGEPLAIIEAMKIEHTITAPTDGVVAELLFAAGDLVADGDELLRIDSDDNQ